MIVRAATISDAAELSRLRWDFRVEEQKDQSRTAFIEACTAWFQTAVASGRWVIAVAGSESGPLSGCMCLEFIEKVPAPGVGQRRAWGYLTNAYVESQARGQGVGGKLLGLLIDAAHSRELEFVLVWPSEEAVAFYHRAGFRELAETSGDEGPPPLQLIF